MLISLICLAFFASILIYIVYNLVTKLETYEDIVQRQVDYMQNISYIIEESNRQLKQIDDKELYKTDDEIGVLFSHMLDIQKELDIYTLSNKDGQQSSPKEETKEK
jgi:hypothetical protein